MTPPRVTSPHFHTVAYVANILGVAQMTVHREIKRGNLRAYRIGHSVRIDAADLVAYMRNAEIDGEEL
jgi:excisionase family DNA binding protein